MRTTVIRNPRGYEQKQAKLQRQEEKTLNILSRNVLRYVECHGKALWARSVFELYYELASCEQVLHGTGLRDRYKETQYAMLQLAVSMLVESGQLVYQVDPNDYSVVVGVPAPQSPPALLERTATPVASADVTSLFRHVAINSFLKDELLAHG